MSQLTNAMGFLNTSCSHNLATVSTITRINVLCSENSEILSFGILWVAGYSYFGRVWGGKPVEQRGQEYWLCVAASEVSDINVYFLYFLFLLN